MWLVENYSISDHRSVAYCPVISCKRVEVALNNSPKMVFSGIKTYLEGVRWLRQHPRYMFVLSVPTLLGLLSLIFILGLFFGNFFTIMDGIMFARPDMWLLVPLYWVLYALLAVVLFLLSFVPPLLVSSVLAAPLYEIVSCAVERDRLGTVVEISWRQSLLMVVEEAKKVSFILLLTLLAMLIPGLNVLALFIPAFLLGWDFCDYPLARRGWSFKRRLRFTFNNFWQVTGLGLWLIIPALQFILAPLAVAGGTLLTISALNDADGSDK